MITGRWNKTLTPRGCITLHPEAARRKRAIEAAFIDLTERWGYREVVTPIFEFIDVISPAVGEDLLAQGYKITDRQSGRVMIIRPDVTPQIGRLAATTLRNKRPLRLSYSLNIFRYDETGGGRQQELFQSGAELIGISDPEGDAEILTLLIEILEHLKVSGYIITLNNRNFLNGLFDEYSRPDMKDTLREIFLQKDLPELKTLLKLGMISKKEYQVYSHTMFLYGGEEILSNGLELSNSPVVHKSVENIRTILGFMKELGYSEKVRIDLAEARGFDYHTGVFFDVISTESGEVIGSGGRYDAMIRHFGSDTPATGFSLNLNQIIGLSSLEECAPSTVLISDTSGDKRYAFTVSQKLRKSGLFAVREVVKREFQQTLEFTASEGIDYILRIEGTKRAKNFLLHVLCKKEDPEVVSLIKRAINKKPLKIVNYTGIYGAKREE